MNDIEGDRWTRSLFKDTEHARLWLFHWDDMPVLLSRLRLEGDDGWSWAKNIEKGLIKASVSKGEGALDIVLELIKVGRSRSHIKDRRNNEGHRQRQGAFGDRENGRSNPQS